MKDKLKIGILYPLYSAEDDYPRLAAALKPPVKVQVIHTDSPNLHRIDESLITGSREYLLAGCRGTTSSQRRCLFMGVHKR